MKRKTTGMVGEKLAADFLSKKGYKIIETNYRCKEGEVDIITKEGETLVFVEVRTRTVVHLGVLKNLSPSERKSI